MVDIESRRLYCCELTTLIVGAAAAYATIPDGNDLYTACRLNGVGTIRLIDPSGPSGSLLSRCTQLETQIQWNKEGQKGASGVSPTVAQLPAGDAHCPAGGAAITDAANTTAYLCSGPFSGTFTSPNGQYSLTVGDTGVDISGPNHLHVTLTGGDGIDIRTSQDVEVRADRDIEVEAGNNATVRASNVIDLGASNTVKATGGLVTLNRGGNCHFAARVGDPIVGSGGGDAPVTGSILSGSTSVCIG